MSAEARFLVVTAADLVACTSRLQTAPRGAVSLFFLGAFVAVLGREDIESKTITETIPETIIVFRPFVRDSQQTVCHL
jgi:hypothetical protein